MRSIYTIGIHILALIIRIASWRNRKARLWISGRKKLLQRIRDEKDPSVKTVWFHCASLGEFEQGRPLIEEVKRLFPEKKIALTFFSSSGYEVKKNDPLADFIYYLPLDTIRNARKFIRLINPEVVFFIKYEYWQNFLLELKRETVPVYFVSCIFREKQLFFKKYGNWYRKMLGLVTHFFLQNHDSAHLLESIGITNYSVCGDTRFDRVAHLFDRVKPLEVVKQFLENEKAIIAGSSWKAEEAMFLQYLRNHPLVKLIIVPHEVTDENISRIEKQFGISSIRYSRANKNNLIGKNVLIIDCYGLLTSVYQYGKLAVIGGGFGAGIHNVLEAATFGLPIIFGPNYQRFKEAVDLVEQKCAFAVQNIEEFNTILNHLLSKPELIQSLSEQTTAYVRDNIGATQKIISRVFNI